MGGVGKSWEELEGVGRSWEELGGVGRSWEELGGVGRSWEELGRVGRSWEESSSLLGVLSEIYMAGVGSELFLNFYLHVLGTGGQVSAWLGLLQLSHLWL